MSAESDAEIAVLRALAYVPGRWVCPKCGCTLGKSVLSTATGDIYASTERGECPNDGSPMDPVLWRDAAKFTERWAERTVDSLRAEVVMLTEALLNYKRTRPDDEVPGSVKAAWKVADEALAATAADTEAWLAQRDRKLLEGFETRILRGVDQPFAWDYVARCLAAELAALESQQDEAG